MDAVPFLGVEALDKVMEYVTIKGGHFEINYGDAHFRRTDNGNAMLNPFIGNYIMDSFTTEIGGEVYFRSNGALAMVGITGGEIRGTVENPDTRKPSYYGKLRYDRQLQDDVRVRLTGSATRSTVVTARGAVSTRSCTRRIRRRSPRPESTPGSGMR